MPKPRAKEVQPTSRECCSVQALVRIDDRGQMVLPKDVRERAGLCAGDRLALTMIERDGRVCCLVLSRADDFVETVRGMLSPAAGRKENQ